METNTETVCKEIRARRKYGRTACRVREWICEAPGATNSAVDAIDAFVAEMGFTGLGRMWAEISLDQARAILQQILQKDLAYQLPIMTEKDALGLADRFLAFFDEGIRCFTNGNAPGFSCRAQNANGSAMTSRSSLPESG